nr:ParB N-terminal domain-containing protein [uncultured Methylophaga sp.]
MSELETASFESGYRLLEEALANGTPAPIIKRNTLPLSSIGLMPEVFQPRSIDDLASSEAHIQTLMNAAMNESGNLLDPLVVWWSGAQWLVLDGHHRLEAYQRISKKQKGAKHIPVKALTGSLKEAIVESTRLNAKDKLPMTKDDKTNRAWQLVLIGQDYSKREISEVCKVGTSTIGRMRARLEELKQLYSDTWADDIEGLSWKEVLNFDGQPRDFDEDRQEKLAIDWARRLTKTFGNKPANQPETFARALEIHSPHLHEQLSEYLSFELNDDF